MNKMELEYIKCFSRFYQFVTMLKASEKSDKDALTKWSKVSNTNIDNLTKEKAFLKIAYNLLYVDFKNTVPKRQDLKEKKNTIEKNYMNVNANVFTGLDYFYPAVKYYTELFTNREEEKRKLNRKKKKKLIRKKKKENNV